MKGWYRAIMRTALSLIYIMTGQIAKEILGAPQGHRRRDKLWDFEGKGLKKIQKEHRILFS
jgi:hypothetical protein